MNAGDVRLQVNELGSLRNVCTVEATAENEAALIDATGCLRRVVPEYVSFRLLYSDGHHDTIVEGM